ncbi:MAG: DMT family transporter [Acidimicrobiales bacterium]|nr:DMT family transporter [Acidimicrobiales bacterium]
MLGVLLAALAGLSYGASDFSGAVASKAVDATLVTVVMQVVSLVALVGLVVVFSGDATTADLAWGALGGVCAAFALATFYRALALGPMSTAAAITAMIGSIVPIAAGLALGDRPALLTMVGVALTVPAAVLVSAADPALHGAVPSTPRERVAAGRHANRTKMLSVAAGLGFGLFFIALSRTSDDAGLHPLLGARVASIAALSLVLTTQSGWTTISRRHWPAIVLAGLADCAANTFYLTALDHGSFTWIAAISSLYPVSTVLLARLVLKERLSGGQILGFGLAAGALSLVAIGANS